MHLNDGVCSSFSGSPASYRQCLSGRFQNDLLEDIDAYRDIVDRIHADPYRLVTPAQFEDKVVAIKRKVQLDKSERFSATDCLFYLQALPASIQDGHTHPFSR